MCALRISRASIWLTRSHDIAYLLETPTNSVCAVNRFLVCLGLCYYRHATIVSIGFACANQFADTLSAITHSLRVSAGCRMMIGHGCCRRCHTVNIREVDIAKRFNIVIDNELNCQFINRE